MVTTECSPLNKILKSSLEKTPIQVFVVYLCIFNLAYTKEVDKKHFAKKMSFRTKNEKEKFFQIYDMSTIVGPSSLTIADSQI